MGGTPFWAGKNAKILFFVDDTKVEFDVESWNCKPNVTEIDVGICGDDRDENQRIVNYFEISLTGRIRDMKVLQALLQDVDNDDGLVEPLAKDVAMSIKPNDGTRVSFAAQEVTIGAWELSVGGRKELASVTIPMKARYFKEI